MARADAPHAPIKVVSHAAGEGTVLLRWSSPPRFIRDSSAGKPRNHPSQMKDHLRSGLSGTTACVPSSPANRKAVKVLDGLDLSGANFNGAVLTNTSFRLTKLDGAIFIGADLRNADLTAARADKAEFLGANLDGATLHTASLDGASLRNADLRNTDLSYTSVRGTLFYGSKFSKHTFSVDPKMGGQDFVCYDENTQWPDGAIPSEGLFAKDQYDRKLE